MNDSGPARAGLSEDIPPHAFDPVLNPELFDGVLARRIVAFFIDLFILAVPILLLAVFIAIFGLVTFGLGWLLFWLLPPFSIFWALLYYGFTLGSPASATIGMRFVDIEMRTWYGSPAYFVLGAVHAIVFWVTISFLTPFILLIGLLNRRQQLLHDMLLGVVIINNPMRAQALRGIAGGAANHV
ncbi:MAG: RDD family protein [Xanthobacteraceae bacterium]